MPASTIRAYALLYPRTFSSSSAAVSSVCLSGASSASIYSRLYDFYGTNFPREIFDVLCAIRSSSYTFSCVYRPKILPLPKEIWSINSIVFGWAPSKLLKGFRATIFQHRQHNASTSMASFSELHGDIGRVSAERTIQLIEMVSFKFVRTDDLRNTHKHPHDEYYLNLKHGK